MKNIKIILLIASLFAMISCADFLTQEPQDSLTESNAFTEYADAEMLMAACYDGLQKGHEEYYVWYYLILSEAVADNAYSGGDDIDIINMGTKNINALNAVVQKTWKSLYGGIMRCNVALQNIPNINDSQLDEEIRTGVTYRQDMLAQAYFLRAFHYYNLVKTFGCVPLVLTTGSTDPEDVQLPKVDSEDEIYAQIFADLEEAIEHLPAERGSAAETRGLASLGAANTLFAKAYAMKGAPDNVEWDKVKYYSDLVLNSSTYTLIDEYDHLYDDQHRNNNETILAVQYTTGSQEANYAPILMLSPDLTGQNWRKYLIPSQDLIKAFEDEGDSVRAASTYMYEDIENQWYDEYYAQESNGGWVTNEIPFAYKWRASNRSGWDCSDLIYIFRLGDIALLNAEAINQISGYSAAAQSTYLQKIRTRAGLSILNPTSDEEMTTLLLKERRLELAYEGERFYDLKRYGVLKSTIDKAVRSEVVNGVRVDVYDTIEEYMTLMPIPQEELDRNYRLTQNEGYN